MAAGEGILAASEEVLAAGEGILAGIGGGGAGGRARSEGTAGIEGGGEGGLAGIGGFGGSFERVGIGAPLAGIGGLLGREGGTAGIAGGFDGIAGGFDGFADFADFWRVGRENRGRVDCVPVRDPRSVFRVSPFPPSGRIQGAVGPFCGMGGVLAGTGAAAARRAGADAGALAHRGWAFLRRATRWLSCTISAVFSPADEPSTLKKALSVSDRLRSFCSFSQSSCCSASVSLVSTFGGGRARTGLQRGGDAEHVLVVAPQNLAQLRGLHLPPRRRLPHLGSTFPPRLPCSGSPRRAPIWAGIAQPPRVSASKPPISGLPKSRLL